MDDIDLLIIGAGPVGCVIAERAATQLGWKCLMVEKRDHIAGNCHDRIHETGVLIHQYGPHYFRTDHSELLDYLSRFTAWVPGNYRVQSQVRGELYPFPINLTTLEKFFRREINPQDAPRFLENLQEKLSRAPRNSEEFVLSRVGRELYEAFYLGYTRKQWELHPRDLDASVCGRIPVRLNRDDRYAEERFQVTPAEGFTALFQKMISRPGIRVLLNTDFRALPREIKPSKATVYCGPVDAYFDYRFGKLQWRSLEFDFQAHNREFIQPCVQINYPNDHDYTRTVEIKHITGQKHPKTVISREFSRSQGDPYYPIPTPRNREMYGKYRECAEAETRASRVYFCGRLATYAYLNTDQAIENALATFEQIRKEVAFG